MCIKNDKYSGAVHKGRQGFGNFLDLQIENVSILSNQIRKLCVSLVSADMKKMSFFLVCKHSDETASYIAANYKNFGLRCYIVYYYLYSLVKVGKYHLHTNVRHYTKHDSKQNSN